ncbi:MAG TPA: anaerobic glycerol-3-phosphate dehydrogenase subunit GlpA [Anaerolineales bacterium]|nr:anaerobic glycerol-3-phosphate dehydrogenase subunit GlpA [Anaerolineales bacterium]
MKLSTEILVLGGGATGLGAAWDAALRGFKTVALEKGDLAHGASGRYHGLLHSGGRYVIRDPQSARECAAENALLRKIIPSAIEDTGGFFVTTPADPADYADQFLAACKTCSVPVAEIKPAEALKREPLLNPKISRALCVHDASCDSFDALHLLAGAVKAADGEVMLRHRVTEIIKSRDRVVGVAGENLTTGEHFTIYADIILNCAGAWAGRIAEMAGCEVKVTPGKGVMIAMNTRLVNTAINRCKPPDDGDILVPVGTVSIIGTTDTAVPDPDKFAVEDWEVELLMAEGEQLIPSFRQHRALRAWAGVRPLYEDTKPPPGGGSEPPGGSRAKDSRLMSRAHALLDHETRDGVAGMLSMVGGKFTTFRHMAELLVDAACAKLNTERKCTTKNTLVEPAGTKLHTLSKRLSNLEGVTQHATRPPDYSATRPPDALICECELVTRAQIEQHVRESGSPIINDLRRDLRLGMGPCQAGFCAYRAAGIVHETLRLSNTNVNSQLKQFLQERWKGERPLMWGHSLRSLELDLHIYKNIFGVDTLPTERETEVYPTERTS